ncbi:MAG: 30S ribosomal protein S4 [Candidatus Micrarchaeota archaeon]|nr:30S ribosomal protein S4 [Candidatus Micrarchaeota archaeon]
MRRLRRKYETPKKPYDKARIEKEKELLEKYGLRRKREIWRAESILRRIRRRAREILAHRDEAKEKELVEKVVKMGLLSGEPAVEDILGLTVEDILERRLQTLVYRKGLARTPKQARQFIVHGHIAVDGRKAVWPGMLVPKDMEEKISFYKKNLMEGEGVGKGEN